MFVTPLSAIARHRMLQHGSHPNNGIVRLPQLRDSTIRLFPELAPQGNKALADDHAASLLRDAAKQARLLRPHHDATIDQCHIDINSLVHRIAVILFTREIAQTRIAFVGDDDLASVALLQVAQPEQLLLLDIDERILSAVESVALELGQRERLAIGRVDLSAPADVIQIVAEHGEGFDVVVTDPPYATDGMLRFVHVAMALTAYTGEVHIAVPALLAETWTDELLLNVQEILVTSGFVIDRVEPGAFTYETSDVISSLVVARRLPGGPAISEPDSTKTDRFYTTRVAPTQKSLLTHPTTRSIDSE